MSEPAQVPDSAGSPSRPASRRGGTGSGPGRLLVAVYAVFALAATARSGVQLATKFSEAPLAYLLSALSGLVYVAATVGLARAGRVSRRVALTAICVELVGVLAVGTASVLAPERFPDATVWSDFGQGYGYVPLVLPFVGLWWLRRTATASPRDRLVTLSARRRHPVGGSTSPAHASRHTPSR